jgi:7-cyano-7-deazaguanine reductase
MEYVSKIEEMSDEELRKRIEKVFNSQIREIRIIPFLAKEKPIIEYVYPELVARCPMTGIKDLYKIKIKFVPNDKIPELKSLKYYFMAFEDIPISHEYLVAKIYEDFEKTFQPQRLAIVLFVASRGEIQTTVIYGDKELLEYGREKEDESFGR